ncbi:MAG: hypothetical protein WKF88_09335 [Ferruginibacter sp.]
MNATCITNLIGLRSLCAGSQTQPVFFIDDIEGLNQTRLTELATPRDGSGTALAKFLTESAARLMLADIDSIMPSAYRVNNELSSLCSSCTFSGFFNNASSSGTGVIIKNMSNSRFTSLIIDSLKVKVNTTGTFTLQIKDKAGVTKDITTAFVAGEELTIQGIGFETTDKQLSIYFTDPAVQLFTITCPTGSSCGCGGSSTSTLATDIIITGFINGIEGVTQSGILPCVKIRCSYDDIICDLVQASPRLFGLALLYLVASKVFEENVMSTRVNRTASFDKEAKKTESEIYYSLYRERLKGNSRNGVLGIAQAVDQNLKNIKDKCIACSTPVGIAWATG